VACGVVEGLAPGAGRQSVAGDTLGAAVAGSDAMASGDASPTGSTLGDADGAAARPLSATPSERTQAPRTADPTGR